MFPSPNETIGVARRDRKKFAITFDYSPAPLQILLLAIAINFLYAKQVRAIVDREAAHVRSTVCPR